MHTNKNDGDTLNPDPTPHGHPGPRDPENPGYETTDVNVSGVVVFLAGLSGFLLVFFFVCFFLGKTIDNAIEKADGPVTKWNRMSEFAGAATTNGKREDLANNPELQQKQLQEIARNFPEPVLEPDDGLQATADLHAREDLLLEHYSTSPSEPGTIRIPIDVAMQLIAKRGLPQAPQAAAGEELAGDHQPQVQVPLTDGFARTGYELDTIESREQKLSYERARAESK